MKQILVYGGTGDQGLPLIDSLIEAGYSVRAVTRNPEALKGVRVDAVWGDFLDLDSLTAASEGMDGVAMNLPFVHDTAYAEKIIDNVLAAASEKRVSKIVFNTSCVVMDHDLGIAAHDGRRRIEAAIERSGLAYTVIRPTVFMDNIARPWIKPSIVKDGIFAYPAAEHLKISWICLDDVARCMTGALGAENLDSDKITVGGVQALTGHEVAALLSQAAGRPIVFRSIPPQEFAENMNMLVNKSREIKPNSVYDGMAKFYRWYNNQQKSPLAVDSNSVRRRLGVETIPFLEWAQDIDWNSV